MCVAGPGAAVGGDSLCARRASMVACSFRPSSSKSNRHLDVEMESSAWCIEETSMVTKLCLMISFARSVHDLNSSSKVIIALAGIDVVHTLPSPFPSVIVALAVIDVVPALP